MDIDTLLNLAIERKASDLHLSEGSPPIIRCDGNLELLVDFLHDHRQIRETIFSNMTTTQRKIFDENLEIDYAYCRKDNMRFRVNAFHQARGIAATYRLIPKTIPTFAELQLPDSFSKFCDHNQGLILVTGPTGSGKSTTLAAMINFINSTKPVHIITIEDPIEFLHKSEKSLINQRELNRDTKSFQSALHSALREDPDIILIGEMRDFETIRLALTAAETGHLVLATLHTGSAPGTIDRIVDTFPGEEKLMIRSMLSEFLLAIISQTLIKKIQGGRVPVFEILINTPAVRNLIRENKPALLYSTMQTSQSLGMCTFEQYQEQLARKNLITLLR